MTTSSNNMTKKIPTPLQSALPMSPATNLQPKPPRSPSPSRTKSSSSLPHPKLRLECRDLNHKGANTFFGNANPATDVSTAVSLVLSILYGPEHRGSRIPPTRSVTLILRPMGGVAYTTGLEIDNDHKEIHFSLDYIYGISDRTPGREAQEIQGVLVHEMVHAWQWNGKGTAPSGLIEGIADFVRGQAGLSPPHWKKEPGDQWDAGYQHTAFFLEWIEQQFGKGSVRRINAALGDRRYDDSLWEELFGKSVNALWKKYQESLKPDDGHDCDPPAASKDTAAVT